MWPRRWPLSRSRPLIPRRNSIVALATPLLQNVYIALALDSYMAVNVGRDAGLRKSKSGRANVDVRDEQSFLSRAATEARAATGAACVTSSLQQRHYRRD